MSRKGRTLLPWTSIDSGRAENKKCELFLALLSLLRCLLVRALTGKFDSEYFGSSRLLRPVLGSTTGEFMFGIGLQCPGVVRKIAQGS